MSNHNNEEIKKHIDSSEELVKKMGSLQDSMVDKLNTGFEKLMGEKIPTIRHCKIRQVDTAMQMTSEVKIDHFLSSVIGLASAAFSGDMAEVATKATAIASVGLQQIFGSMGVSTEIKGDSAIVEHDGEEYLTAMYAVTQVCSHTQWFTETDFVVASYVFLVTRALPKEDAVNALAATGARAALAASDAGWRPSIMPELRL
jgi:hypothetical protein